METEIPDNIPMIEAAWRIFVVESNYTAKCSPEEIEGVKALFFAAAHVTATACELVGTGVVLAELERDLAARNAAAGLLPEGMLPTSRN